MALARAQDGGPLRALLAGLAPASADDDGVLANGVELMEQPQPVLQALRASSKGAERAVAASGDGSGPDGVALRAAVEAGVVPGGGRRTSSQRGSTR